MSEQTPPDERECIDCDGTGWYDGDNRCPNGCPSAPAPVRATEQADGDEPCTNGGRLPCSLPDGHDGMCRMPRRSDSAP